MSLVKSVLTQGCPAPPKRMNFRKSSKRPLTPPLIFGKLYCKFFKLATKPSKDGANRNINLGLKLGCTFLFSSGQGLNETRAQQLITQLNNKRHSRVFLLDTHCIECQSSHFYRKFVNRRRTVLGHLTFQPLLLGVSIHGKTVLQEALKQFIRIQTGHSVYVKLNIDCRH